MRILATSDWHVDAVTAGVERLPEIADHVDALSKYATQRRADLIVACGDYHDPGSVHDPRWTAFVYTSLTKLGHSARSGAIAIPGNHDVVDLDEPCSTLSGLKAAQSPCVSVLELPGVRTVGADEGHIATVLALPYVSRGVERSAAYKAALEKALEDAKRYSRFHPLVVITHLAFEGMTPGSETTDMARGREVLFPVSDVEALKPEVVLAGHYHARQTIRRGRLDVHIIGAPIRFTFGEMDEEPRGFLEVEV
jgi:DNA repair exonuclease SbcCD nuclease subunit